jgi:hypothetical protein
MGDRLAEAYDHFITVGREMRELIEATPRFTDHPEHRAQAYATLAEATAQAYAQTIAPHPGTSRLHAQTAWHSTIFGVGGNCQDFKYGITLLDGRQTYRLRGRIGAAKLCLFQIQSGVQGTPGIRTLGNYDLHDFADADGNFEAVLSAKEHDGTWFPLDGDSATNYVMVRRILGSIADDSGELAIEAIDGPQPAPETDPDAMAERFDLGADLLRFFVTEWAIGLSDLYLKVAGGHPNVIGLLPGAALGDAMAGSPSTTYGFGCFDLAHDEALIIEWEPPDSAYWSFQVLDVWSNPLDFTNYQTGLNMETIRLDTDGRVRMVISAADPGVPNWLDTRDRGQGQMIVRNYRARGEATTPKTRLVKLADVRTELPFDTPEVTPEQRAEALRSRRAAYLAAFGD